ncbi:MAG: PhoH family protein [Salibacteraceae bacterium]|nr:PhoH family protein [Salibacteraceae bacterium]MDP4762077.1 PhoH family protein [Salibacteraceae bacterium]MDP4843170.1 PhoH family protein [Salibacteraceae bacterium]MDP4933443.1 PhoH family protein [Salibacteraceae bacterium]MDP4964172.1 PhoH family protein [Salibacteraceae bacterium]
MPPRKKKERKIFVLDTSVILHDHQAINNFDEHDICLPITVLEELDNFKRGKDTKNYEAREFIRLLDKLSADYSLQQWIPLEGEKKGKFKIIMSLEKSAIDAEKIFSDNKADHKILNTVVFLKNTEKDAKVILVTKDINLRLKAKALDLYSEDYETGKIIDISQLYQGSETIDNVDSDYIRKLYTAGYTDDVSIFKKVIDNHYYIIKNGKTSSLAYYNPLTLNVERVEKLYTYGIKPKNAEQTFALHALMNPNIKLVTVQGVAGTGKTLLALASALEQKKDYNQIILARPLVPLSNRDIGFLPGSAERKIDPYMMPLWDNLEFIKSQFTENEKRYKQIMIMLKEKKIEITPLAFIRGRSLSNVYFIVDEAQNLTPHEVKTIITRAGENTKIVFTGDVNQIDTPYLDEQSNGLSYIIDRLKGNALFAHITLTKGERSELANLANELL